MNEGKIPGISGIRNESDLKEPVRLVCELKRDADPDIVLNQLYQFSPLQDSFSLNFLALVDGKPRVLSFKELLQEFLRHRETVIRRRTQFLLARARQRKHTVEGLLLAHANIDEVIRVIRSSSTQTEAKERLMKIQTPVGAVAAGAGRRGFRRLPGRSRAERVLHAHARPGRRHPANDARTIGQPGAGKALRRASQAVGGDRRVSPHPLRPAKHSRHHPRGLPRVEAEARRRRAAPKSAAKRSASSNMEDLITEETMVVSISSNGYIKRTPASVYRSQRRGGKGLTGAKTEEEDPIQHLFVASTHAYLLFFTNKGKVYWRKVYDLPQLARDGRGRAVVNLLNLGEGEQITDCRAVRDFDQPDHFLVMATARGLVKKTPLEAYSRPMKSGIIAIKLREGDALVDVVVAKPGDELVLATAHGMAIRFKQSDARADGPQLQRREGHQAGRRRLGGGHGRGRSRGHAADRLRQRLRQADAVRPEHGGRVRGGIARPRRRRRRSIKPRPTVDAGASEEPEEGEESEERKRVRSAAIARSAAAARACATSRRPTATARWSASSTSPTPTSY